MEKIKKRKWPVIVLSLFMVMACMAVPVESYAAEYTITNNGSVTDGTSRVGRFVIDGKPVFCCDHEKTTPPTGTKATKSLGSNADIAKVLYYGYGGPGQWSGFEDDNAAIVATSLALDHYFNSGTGNGNPNYNAFMKFLASKDTLKSGASYILYTTGKESYQRLAAVNPNINVSVSVTKESVDKVFTDGNACYTLQGAQYGIYSGNRLLTTISTDKDGKASAVVTVNPAEAGSLTVKEMKASEGYVKDGNTYVKDGTSGKIFILSKEPPTGNPAEILLHKYDSETTSAAQKGATLAGAVFKVDFYGIKHEEIPADNDYSKFKPLRTWYFRTDESGSIKWDKAFFAEGYEQSELYYYDNKPTLPLGVVTIKEIEAPKGYLLNETLYVSEIRTDGEKIAIDSYSKPEVPNKIKRGDLEFCKTEEGSNHRMSGIPFKITSLRENGKKSENGESHIIVTDANGYVSTADAFNSHTYRTNVNDSAWNGKYIDDSKIDASAGIWFGEKTAIASDRGALPYGRYVIDELPCKNNEGYMLLKGIEIEVSRDTHVIKLGTLTNKKAEIKTGVWDSDINAERETLARENLTLTDRVNYKGLEAGTEYTLKGILMDKATGKPIISGGKEVISEKTFTAQNSDGSEDMKFTFDASALKGKEIVVFETLLKEGLIVARHEDINDVNQTIKFLNPMIGTIAKAGETGNKYAEAEKMITIVDQVNYSGLLSGRTYEMTGILMDKATGKPLLVNGREITAKKEFKAEKPDGYIEMEFVFDASAYGGRDIVAFETISLAGMVIAEHKDINDDDQTISIRPVTAEAIDTGDRLMPAVLPALTLMTLTCLIAVIVFLKRRESADK